MTDVIIFCGQSNMQGVSECLSENIPVNNAWEYKYCSDELVPLRNPVGEDITYDGKKGFAYTFNEKGWKDENAEKLSQWRTQTALGAACYGYTNLVPSFCREYLKGSEKKAVAIHVAKGSTQIVQWQDGSDIYKVMLQKVSKGIKKIGVEQINKVYFIWLQGESDACMSVSKKEYLENLIKLKNSLKKDIGIDRFGIIKVGDFANDERDKEIQNAQEEVCKIDSDFVMLTTISNELLETGYVNPYHRGHYSAKGLEILGTSAGNALSKI